METNNFSGVTQSPQRQASASPSAISRLRWPQEGGFCLRMFWALHPIGTAGVTHNLLIRETRVSLGVGYIMPYNLLGIQQGESANLGKTQTQPWPHSNTGFRPCQMPVRGSFHLTSGKAALVGFHKRSAVGWPWESTFKKFKTQSVRFKKLSGVWGYMSPFFYFFQMKFQWATSSLNDALSLWVV